MPPIPPPRDSGATTTTPVPLHWVAYGPADAPTLLVLHGGPGASHEYLLPQMLELTQPGPGGAHQLQLYDQRGGGRSRHDDDRETITWQSQVADVARVSDELSLHPLDLVGYSWGGLLALLHLVAASQGHHPAPRRLVLLDPAPVTRAWRTEFEAEFARRQAGPEVQALREELAASGLRERDPAAFRQRSFELSVAGYFADPHAVGDLTPFRVTGRVQQSTWESLGDYDLSADLARASAELSIPALVIHGRDDPIPLASSERCAELLGAELVVLDDCGHVPYVEQPGATFAAIRGFLARTA